MEFGYGILGGETPVDDGLGLFALPLQGTDIVVEAVLVRVPLSQAAAGYDAELNLRHIQPTAMLGRVVKLQPPGYAPCLRRRERLVQRRYPMGVQVVRGC